ncbi:MAG: LruC domain-containing protein [Byssovorax sp.]
MKRNHKILTAIGAVGAPSAPPPSSGWTPRRRPIRSRATPTPRWPSTCLRPAPTATSRFEDQWPGYGDLDFNDAVISQQYSLAYNTAGNLVQLVGTFNVPAAGSGHDNGFGLQLPIPKANVSSVTLQLGNGAPSALVPRAAESNLVVDAFSSIKAGRASSASPTTVTRSTPIPAPPSSRAPPIASSSPSPPRRRPSPPPPPPSTPSSTFGRAPRAS